MIFSMDIFMIDSKHKAANIAAFYMTVIFILCCFLTIKKM